MDVQDVGQPPSYTRRWKDGRTRRWRPAPADPPPAPPVEPAPEPVPEPAPVVTDVLPVVTVPPTVPPTVPQPPAGRSRSWLVAGALVLAAAGGVGVGAALGTNHRSGDGPAGPPPATSSAAGAPSATGRPAALRTRGTVTAQSGSSWTVRTADGGTLTVTITPATTWGTRTRAATRAQFHVGSPVVIFGRVVGSAVTAVRILAPAG